MSYPPSDGTGIYPSAPAPDPDEGGDDVDPEPETPSAADPGTAAVDEAQFDPSEHTVAEVQDYLAAHPDETDTVLERERAGKARTTLIGD